MRQELEEKIEFVKELDKVLPKYIENIEHLTYDVFENAEKGWYAEYVVIWYVGGSRTVRNCEGDSCAAIYEEISKYLYKGYYDELEDYHYYETNPSWEKVSG